MVGRRRGRARVVYLSPSSVAVEKQIDEMIIGQAGTGVPNNVWRSVKINQSVGWSQ
jgi:hypothetical protein